MAFKKILCPTDFSEVSFSGLAKAVELAAGNETEICVIYVDQPLAGESGGDKSAHRAEAVRNLHEVLSEQLPTGVRSQPILRIGDAATEIVRAAQLEGADLIVLTTHGAQGWKVGILGTVAEKVLCNSTCPVLTVSGPASGGWNLDVLKQHDGAMKPALQVITKGALILDGD